MLRASIKKSGYKTKAKRSGADWEDLSLFAKAIKTSSRQGKLFVKPPSSLRTNKIRRGGVPKS